MKNIQTTPAMQPHQPPPEPFAQAANEWNLQKLYEDLASVKKEFAPNTIGLTVVEKQLLQGLLCRYNPAKIAEKLFRTPGSVKVDLSNSIYRYVEALTGRQPNELRSWSDVKEWLESAGYRTQSIEAIEPFASNGKIIDWGEALDASVFFGRETELATLIQWLVTDRCRLIALQGLGGIGKTTLAAQVADRVKNEFDCLIWKSILYPIAPKVILTKWLRQLSQQDNLQVPDHLEDQISCLIQILQQRRCLLVLDSLETIFQKGQSAGCYQTEYRGYGELLKRVGQERHQSCILLTSQVNPSEINVIAGNTLPVRYMKLDGLSDEAARSVLHTKGLLKEEQWNGLIRVYRGNPLLLKIAAVTIQDMYGDNVNAFLTRKTYITGDMKPFLDQLFRCLSNIEKEVMKELARVQQPITLLELEQSLQPSLEGNVLEALESLVRRSLVERGATQGFTLQPIIAAYVNQFLE